MDKQKIISAVTAVAVEAHGRSGNELGGGRVTLVLDYLGKHLNVEDRAAVWGDLVTCGMKNIIADAVKTWPDEDDAPELFSLEKAIKEASAMHYSSAMASLGISDSDVPKETPAWNYDKSVFAWSSFNPTSTHFTCWLVKSGYLDAKIAAHEGGEKVELALFRAGLLRSG